MIFPSKSCSNKMRTPIHLSIRTERHFSHSFTVTFHCVFRGVAIFLSTTLLNFIFVYSLLFTFVYFKTKNNIRFPTFSSYFSCATLISGFFFFIFIFRFILSFSTWNHGNNCGNLPGLLTELNCCCCWHCCGCCCWAWIWCCGVDWACVGCIANNLASVNGRIEKNSLI